MQQHQPKAGKFGHGSRRAVIACALLCLCLATPARATEDLLVAVAANFAAAMTEIARLFERETGHDVRLAVGSSGKHYAQILHGAPFDLFFAADKERPELLEKAGRGIAGSRITYALGQLVLWSRDADRIDADATLLRELRFEHLAIANPELAPYGRAAQESLEALGLFEQLRGRLVRGENIAQTLQFVESGSAQLGLVAWPQLRAMQISAGSDRPPGSYWRVPAKLHRPIEQQVIQLSDKTAAAELLNFVRSDAALRIIRTYGYLIPG